MRMIEGVKKVDLIQIGVLVMTRDVKKLLIMDFMERGK